MTAVQAPEGATMTEDQVRALLALLVALDARMKAPDENTAALRVRAWSVLLQEVDPAYAMRYAEHAYQETRDWPLQPAEILQGWRAEQAAGRARAEAAYRQQHPEERQAGPVEMAAYVRACVDALANGRDPLLIPRPAITPLSPEQDAYLRRCVYHRICACDHLHCREGFLDDETTIINSLGRTYVAVARCPYCRDAIVMAEERGLAKHPGRTARRRG